MSIEMSNKQSSEFYANIKKQLHVFEGCQNMLGVIPLTMAGYSGDENTWESDRELRRMLVEWGKSINSDSVMVLFGNPRKFDEQEIDGKNYHVKMFVFEPCGDDNSGLGGGISTMCGNGVRAVGAYIRESMPDVDEVQVMTRSGLRCIKVEKSDNGEDLYVVGMGEFTSKVEDLSAYVNGEIVKSNRDGRYIDSPIPDEIMQALRKTDSRLKDIATWSIGMNGTRDDGKVDGEPHVVIEIPRGIVNDIQELRALAVAAGPAITKNGKLFPQEINVNFVVVNGEGANRNFEIWNCTHERNLGDDANHSVTQACGTGSTVAGGIMFEKYLAKDPSKTVLVKCTGGDLKINIDTDPLVENGLLMKGPAQRVKK